MKNYLLKCEKWYSTTQSIFSEGRKIGNFFPGLYNSVDRLLFGEKEYIVRKKNVFSNNLSIYSKNELLAEVHNFTFKSESIITTIKRDKYLLRSNIWCNRYRLLGNEGQVGECHQHTTTTTFSFDDKVDDYLIAAIMTQIHSTQQTAILVACFVPIFVILIT